MGALGKFIKRQLEKQGYLLSRMDPHQVIPAHAKDLDLYARPEDFSRLYKTWRSPEFERLLTPDVVQNTMLSRMKLYYLVKFLRQTLDVPGDIFEAGCGSGGGARLMLNVVR